jgi:photosystem II stability/assembly factor-like uncharacterized protein
MLEIDNILTNYNMKKNISFLFLLCLCCNITIAQVVKDNIMNSGTFSAFKFRNIGPAITSGRIADFAVNPLNNSEYYTAVASGGVWKTTNRGVTFSPVFEAEGSYSIGCVSLDPSNPSTVWVGSGENNNQRSVAYGDGVYKSEDAGKSWKNMGLKNSEHISEIIVHPKDPKTIYVGAYGPVWSEGGERGVYKSIDGGATWKCVKSVSKYTGCNDLVMDPSNPEILYAAFHQRMRKVFTYIGGGPESAVYKSIDGGNTWAKLEGGLPSGEIGRIGIAVSKVNPNYVYAVVEAKEGGGTYRSTDKGASWEKRSGTYTSGNYYNEIECDPINVDKIYITDTYYKYSLDGGKTMKNLGEINKHIDNHAIWIDPKDGNHMLVGCDGGIYETYDHAGTWDYKENLPVIQFYKVATDNDFPFYHVHGGTQDNLSLGGPSRTTSENGIVNADWYYTSLGDGFESQVDQSNPNIIYAQAQYGALSRYDRASGERIYIKPIEGKGEAANRWNWDSPLLISQFDNKRLYYGSNRIYKTDDQGNNWKAISGDLSKKIDKNKLEVMGRVWSVDAIAKNQSTDIYGQTTSIAESKYDQDMLWVGTDDGLIQLTVDGGKNWKKIDNLPGVPTNSYVHQIIASQHNKNIAYVCFNHHRYGDFKPYLLKTVDAGLTWKSVASDLPQRGSVYSIAEDHIDPNLLFVGTEFGLFVSTNGGGNWIQMKSGLPTIAIRDIEIQRREDDLVLASFGRGFFVLDDYSALRNIGKELDANKATIFPIKDSWMYIQKSHLGLRDKGFMGSSYYQAENPAPGAVITYFLKDDMPTINEIRKKKEKEKYEKGQVVYYPSIDSLRLEDNQESAYLLFSIKDENNQLVRHLKSPLKKGINKIIWDFRYPTYEPVEGRATPEPDQLFGGATVGHLAMPGTYKVAMYKVQDGELTKLTDDVSFVCKLLPQGSLQTKDMASNVSFYKKVDELTKKLIMSSDLLESMKGRLENIKKATLDMTQDPTSILKEAYNMKQDLIALRISLFGDETKAKREFEVAPTPSDRIYTITGAVWNNTSAIPGMYRESFDIAKSELDGISPKINAMNDKVKAIEKQVHLKGGPYLGRE